MPSFQVTTSLPGLIVGRVIDVDPPFGPDVEAWLRAGILVPVRSRSSEAAIAPAAVEQAIARRAPLTKAQRRRARATATADGAP